METSITVNLSKRMQDWQRSGGRITEAGVAKGLRMAAAFAEGQAKRIVYSGHPEHLEGDTGRLRQSITHQVQPPRAFIGTNVIYARIHEFGGTIVPKRAPMLAFRTKAGDFVRTLKVIIPARPYLRPAVFDNAKKIGELILRGVQGALK